MSTSDPHAKDPEPPKPPPGMIVDDVLADSADYLEGLDEIERKYPPGFFSPARDLP